MSQTMPVWCPFTIAGFSLFVIKGERDTQGERGFFFFFSFIILIIAGRLLKHCLSNGDGLPAFEFLAPAEGNDYLGQKAGLTYVNFLRFWELFRCFTFFKTKIWVSCLEYSYDYTKVWLFPSLCIRRWLRRFLLIHMIEIGIHSAGLYINTSPQPFFLQYSWHLYQFLWYKIFLLKIFSRYRSTFSKLI